jgi:hypothetical protein
LWSYPKGVKQASTLLQIVNLCGESFVDRLHDLLRFQSRFKRHFLEKGFFAKKKLRWKRKQNKEEVNMEGGRGKNEGGGYKMGEEERRKEKESENAMG